MWVSIIVQISSARLYLFSKILMFHVFHICHTVMSRNNSQILFKILFLKVFFSHSAIVRLGRPLCLWFFLKIPMPFSQMDFTIGHSSKIWLIVSLLVSQRQYLDEPINPRAWILSHVRIRRLRRSQLKAATLGHHLLPHIFLHLTSFSILWVSVSISINSLILKFPKLVYPHLSLFGPAFLGIFLEQSSL